MRTACENARNVEKTDFKTPFQAEMRTAEKLLEIELHLAEIGEVTKARPLADTSSPTRMPPP